MHTHDTQKRQRRECNAVFRQATLSTARSLYYGIFLHRFDAYACIGRSCDRLLTTLIIVTIPFVSEQIVLSVSTYTYTYGHTPLGCVPVRTCASSSVRRYVHTKTPSILLSTSNHWDHRPVTQLILPIGEINL